MIITFLGITALILLPCLIFGFIMEKVHPSKSHPISQIEIDRIVAKNHGLELHKASYACGREIYVRPEYQNVSVNSVRWSIRKDGTLGCYQVPAHQA